MVTSAVPRSALRKRPAGGATIQGDAVALPVVVGSPTGGELVEQRDSALGSGSVAFAFEALERTSSFGRCLFAAAER